MGKSVSEGELCDLEERVTGNSVKIVTRFLLAAADLLQPSLQFDTRFPTRY